MLNAFGNINSQRLIIVFMKKTSKKTQTSYYFFSILKTPKTLKNPKKNKKIKHKKEYITKNLVFITQGIKDLPQ